MFGSKPSIKFKYLIKYYPFVLRNWFKIFIASGSSPIDSFYKFNLSISRLK